MDIDRYTIVLRKEEAGGDWAWVARVPELPGCACTEDTPEEALKHIESSIKQYIDFETEQGRPIPPPSADPSGRFTVRVPRWVHRELRLQADSEGLSLNQYVAGILAFGAGRKSVPEVPLVVQTVVDNGRFITPHNSSATHQNRVAPYLASIYSDNRRR